MASIPGKQLWSRKDKDKSSPRASRQHSPDYTLSLAQGNSCWTSNLCNYKGLNLCGFKLLYVWQFDTQWQWTISISHDSAFILPDICPNGNQRYMLQKAGTECTCRLIPNCSVLESTVFHKCTVDSLYPFNIKQH